MVIGILPLVAASAPLAGLLLARFLYAGKSGLPARFTEGAQRLYQPFSRSVFQGRPFEGEFLRRLKAASCALGEFDRNFLDHLAGDCTGSAARAASLATIWCDTWIIDGFLQFIARAIEFASILVRLLQSGLVQRYMLWIVAGLIGLLGVCMYAAHHAAPLVMH